MISIRPTTLTLLAMFFITCVVQAQGKAIMTFDTMTHEFGVVNEGDSAEYIFEFVNSGDIDLVINEVLATCFCTASEWPKEAVPPGEKGAIRVNFDTKGKDGHYAKGINVFSNAGESNLIILIEVESKSKKSDDKAEPDEHSN